MKRILKLIAILKKRYPAIPCNEKSFRDEILYNPRKEIWNLTVTVTKWRSNIYEIDWWGLRSALHSPRNRNASEWRGNPVQVKGTAVWWELVKVLCSSHTCQGLFSLTHLNRVGRGRYIYNKKGKHPILFSDDCGLRELEKCKKHQSFFVEKCKKIW